MRSKPTPRRSSNDRRYAPGRRAGELTAASETRSEFCSRRPPGKTRGEFGSFQQRLYLGGAKTLVSHLSTFDNAHFAQGRVRQLGFRNRLQATCTIIRAWEPPRMARDDDGSSHQRPEPRDQNSHVGVTSELQRSLGPHRVAMQSQRPTERGACGLNPAGAALHSD